MTKPRYTAVAMTLHWLIALMLAGLFALGSYMEALPLSPSKLQLYAWHKWAGVTVFGLVLVRILWRASHRPPALPPQLPRWQAQAAAWSHIALYGLMLAIPLSGWLMSSAKGFTTVYFGVWPLPDLLGKDAALGELLKEVHETLNKLLLLLVSLHTAAALKHHYLDRDDVLGRMWPWPLRRR
jgi:cytochrome b561